MHSAIVPSSAESLPGLLRSAFKSDFIPLWESPTRISEPWSLATLLLLEPSLKRDSHIPTFPWELEVCIFSFKFSAVCARTDRWCPQSWCCIAVYVSGIQSRMTIKGLCHVSGLRANYACISSSRPMHNVRQYSREWSKLQHLLHSAQVEIPHT